MNKNCGVYMIRNTKTNAFYIGSSKNMVRRHQVHRYDLKRGAHHATYMQRAYNKHGVEAFEYSILILCEEKDLLLYEQRAIDALKPKFNGSKVAGRIEHTAEVIAKMKANRKPMSDEKRKALSDRLRVHPLQHHGLWGVKEYRDKVVETHRAKHRVHEYQGRMWSLKEAAEHFGVKYGMLKDRVSRFGWSLAEAIETPKRKGGL